MCSKGFKLAVVSNGKRKVLKRRLPADYEFSLRERAQPRRACKSKATKGLVQAVRAESQPELEEEEEDELGEEEEEAEEDDPLHRHQQRSRCRSPSEKRRKLRAMTPPMSEPPLSDDSLPFDTLDNSLAELGNELLCEDFWREAAPWEQCLSLSIPMSCACPQRVLSIVNT